MSEVKGITSMMGEKRSFKPPEEYTESSCFKSMDEYKKLYQRSIEDPEGFWGEMAEQLDWFKKWDKVVETDFAEGKHQWFIGGKLNVSYNCLDRHVRTWRRNKAALIWEGDIGDTKVMTYQQLYRDVCRFANVLRKLGAKKGDRVSIYLPMIPELPVAMLACARIGAIHSVIFGGFSAEALRDRILDCGSTTLICGDGYYRGGRVIRSKDNADQALESCPDVKNVIVVKRADIGVPMKEGRDQWWHDLMASVEIKPVCDVEVLDSEDPLFILYTSGSTGKPKGVMHTQAGYLLHTYQTFKWIFDVKEEDVFWCTEDIGWVT
ncbi:MAG: AMP-binding protein, partial [Dehalococcoidia bacterium]|nr:AMP-binding protein [Dehalococcoidia bacterium]